MAVSISSHKRLQTATSASWNVTVRPWRTTYAPIALSRFLTWSRR
jgi:hypothetical protein